MRLRALRMGLSYFSTMSTPTAPLGRDDVLRFWYGAQYFDGREPATAGYELNQIAYLEAQKDRWYAGGDAFDEECRAFSDLADAAAGARLTGPEWDAPEGIVARCVLLDQIPRNIHRATPKAFAADGVSQALVKQAIADGIEEKISAAEMSFLCTALMHQEDLPCLDLCLEKLEGLKTRFPSLAGFFSYAVTFGEDHRDVVRRFGRYPSRNNALGRDSTPEELEFLANPDLPGWMRSQG